MAMTRDSSSAFDLTGDAEKTIKKPASKAPTKKSTKTKKQLDKKHKACVKNPDATTRSIKLSDECYIELKVEAARKGVYLSDLVEDILRKHFGLPS